MAGKKRGLNQNRGLEFLLAETLGAKEEELEEVAPVAVKKNTKKKAQQKKVDAQEKGETSAGGSTNVAAIKELYPGRFQPRMQIEPEALEPLVASIKTQGVLQPILVRQDAKGKYEIIAGERRWQAAQKAELTEVPIIVKPISDEAATIVALVENVQRQDLSPLEEAKAYEKLAKQYGLTHEAVAKAVGKKRATITNTLRLLNLRPEVKELLEQGKLEVGHAKLLLGVEPEIQCDLAQVIVKKGLSVRAAEDYLARISATIEDAEVIVKNVPADPDVVRLERRLSEKLGAKVAIACNAKGRGKVTISYNSIDELEGILEHIN